MGRRSTSTRQTTWATVEATASIAAANGFQTLDLLSNFKADGGTQQAVTITRTHLRIIPTAGVQAAGNNFHVGLIRGQMSDVGTNIAGAPTPAAQPYEDWLLWDHLFTDQTASLDAFSGTQLHYDLRSQRRLEELQMNYNLVIDVPASAVFPAVFMITGRVLLKLP
jgi:hypothetical protein